MNRAKKEGLVLDSADASRLVDGGQDPLRFRVRMGGSLVRLAYEWADLEPKAPSRLERAVTWFKKYEYR